MSEFVCFGMKARKESAEYKDKSDSPETENNIAQQEGETSRPFQIHDADSLEGEESEPWFEGENDSDSKAYGQGGYLRVKLGQKFNRRYLVEKKLGWGHFSTVWLATDTLTGRLVALKIQKSAVHYIEAAQDEIELLLAAKQKGDKTNFVVQLLDHFDTYKVNGRHFVFVFELLGPDLLSLIKRYKYQGLPMAMVKQITKQVLVALDNLHTKYKIIHTDLKPENVLLSQPEKLDIVKVRQERDIMIKRKMIRQYNRFQMILKKKQTQLSSIEKRRINTKVSRLYEQIEKYTERTKHFKRPEKNSSKKRAAPAVDQNIKDSILNELPGKHPDDEKHLDHTHFPIVKIADLGNACWVHRHFTDDITTCQYRAPESILGQYYDTSVDIWSLATMIFEMVTGDYLFDPKEDRDGRYSKDEDHLAQIIELCGKFNKPFTQKGRCAHKFFNSKGELRHIKKLEIWPLLDVLRQKYKKSDEEAELLASFLSPMLEYNPKCRTSAGKALTHPWLRITQEDWDELLASERDELHEDGYESELTASSNKKSSNQETKLNQIEGKIVIGKDCKSIKLNVPRARPLSV